MSRIVIKPPTVIFFVLMIVSGNGNFLTVPLCAALLHETGHLIAMFILRYPVDVIEITVFGADIRMREKGTNKINDIIVYAAGGAANLLSALIVYLACPVNKTASMFCICSVILAVLNLLPIKTLDGGCICETAAELICSDYYSAIPRIISSVTLVCLWLVSVCLLLVFDGNISLLIFCGYLFFSTCLK